MKPIILASQSPRRRNLLDMLGLDFISIPADTDEFFYPGEKAQQGAERIARQKAVSVARKLSDGLVIAADTVVCCGGEIMGKPCDNEDAFKKLSILSGNSHQVITALCLIDIKKQDIAVESELTTVYFRYISPGEILAYIATGEAADKAGAYGIQGLASVFIDKIDGCYFNVVGLPVSRLYKALKRQGIDLLGGYAR
ncbi:MAG: Maf family protein [Syntrophomonadaceae bacterium]|nr:Maf family protein [Syntrophomonadaceae bacterium]MDD3022961.1 Maf family protein [Syntrophomonadaceae bacterium]